MLAQNLIWPATRGRLEARGWTALTMSRVCVALVGLGALLTAFVGASAYELLEEAYAIGLVSLLVPLLVGLHGERGGQGSALVAMGVGTGAWLVHLLTGAGAFGGALWPATWVPLPVGLCCAALALVAYAATARVEDRPNPSL